jgi:hypothetical protein
MGLPTGPVTLTVAQVEDLNKKLSTLRHDVNGHLALIVAAAELIRHKPQLSERMLTSIGEQPAKISEAMKAFSLECERVLGITRP